MKFAFLASSLVLVVGVSAQRPQVKVPDNLRRHTSDPQMVKLRAAYRKIPIARPSPAVFKHTDWSKFQIKGQYADLRSTISDYGLAIRSQGYRGTCSVFALTFCQEYMTAKTTGKKNLDFSEEYLNVVGDIAAGSVNDGGFYKDLNMGYQFYGHVNESELPYHDPMAANTKNDGKALLYKGVGTTKFPSEFIKDWDPSKGANAAQMKKICDYLDSGIPVAVGLLWPQDGKMQKQVYSGVDMMVKIPKSDTMDGHSVVIVGYKKNAATPGGGYFVFRNSWGDGWGDKGYGHMSFEYVTSYANDLLAYHQ